MPGIVTLKFQGVKLTGGTSSIAVSGGAIVVETNPSLSLSGSFPFTGLSIASGAISITGQAGTTLNGNVDFPVSTTAGAAPTITLTNFSGQVAITWPSSSGTQVQTVSSGDPIKLNGFAN